jgi:hypothetical protein
LAAAAAADKGVELSREALTDYVTAIDPDKRHSAGGDQGGENGFGTGEGSAESSAEAESRGSPRDKDRDREPDDAESLRNKILRAEEQNPLISLMNRLPGKNGQRWMVLPFSFEDQGHDFAVTLRILLKPELIAGAGGGKFRAEQIALEIAAEDSHWLFIANNPPGGKLRLTGSLWPGIAASEKTAAKTLRAMERELAGLLGVEAEQVQIRNEEEFPPFAPDSRDETLLPVNEEA